MYEKSETGKQRIVKYWPSTISLRYEAYIYIYTFFCYLFPVDNTALGEDIKDAEEPLSFATMLRNSRFVQLGRLQNKVVIGRVFEVIDDDLYIDFGGKFMCCCPKPFKQWVLSWMSLYR